MILTLEVIGEQARDLGTGSRKVFNAVGGTIGRLPDNDWVFPDPYVSGRHALIRYLNGRYFIEDTSTNGVFVNSPDKRLSRSDSHPLRDGDVLFIDAYQIKVSLAKDPDAEQRNDPLALLQARHKKPAATARELAPGRDQDHPTGTQWFGVSDMASEPKPALPRASQSSGEDDAQLRALIESAGVEPSSEAAQVLRAVLAAMRLAFASMLSQLDPDRLRDDPDGAFRKLFGDAFAKAYEEQLKRLRGSARSRHE